MPNKPSKNPVFDYPRTPTDAKIRVTFPNGDTFDIPAQVVADDRDANYADEEEDTVGFIRDKGLSDYDLLDWLCNNTNWEDVAPYAVRVEVPPPKVDYESEWCDAKKEILGKI
ncbi:MAG: hypothetical protein KGL39_26925 [Patescibacteria group bacterium]|nr:hypothetical protein [Patescibacteria group bacterium]